MSKGETITITRNGVPAALLIPVGETAKQLAHQEILEATRALRKRIKADRMPRNRAGLQVSVAPALFLVRVP